MTITLATAWNPRGELIRFQRLYPLLASVYDWLVVTLPPWAEADVVTGLDALAQVTAVKTTAWPEGRYQSLKSALETGADTIHYADFDRLLRWVETRSDEWRQTVARVQHSDCLVIGRTAQAWDTHPRALRDTESLSNAVFSDLLGQDLDLSAGSKGFSRHAVAVLVANARSDRPMGADSEWIVLLHRSGFPVEMLRVDGLDWESADRYQSVAANGAVQREAAARYDEDPQHWAMRVGVAAEIVSAGLEALHRELQGVI